jgi:hypothetical protein
MTRPNIRDWARDRVRVTDFITDLLNDSALNRDPSVSGGARRLSTLRGACSEALKQARVVFAEYAERCRGWDAGAPRFRLKPERNRV